MLPILEPFTINTIEFQSFTIYHLPSWKQIKKMGLFKHSVFMCSINCLFLFICLLIFGDLSQLILPLSICIALWDFYYMHLFFQDMEDDFSRVADFLEDDFNRIVDFLIRFWVSFQNFIYVLQIAMEAINLIQWNHNLELNCKYIYMI